MRDFQVESQSVVPLMVYMTHEFFTDARTIWKYCKIYSQHALNPISIVMNRPGYYIARMIDQKRINWQKNAEDIFN